VGDTLHNNLNIVYIVTVDFANMHQPILQPKKNYGKLAHHVRFGEDNFDEYYFYFFLDNQIIFDDSLVQSYRRSPYKGGNNSSIK